ncbi:MAG TPA: sialate O-acetylesterase, partial [Pirellulales bacterium]|nr:sialate O-acetylesterase [Pirellulales bacterium]
METQMAVRRAGGSDASHANRTCRPRQRSRVLNAWQWSRLTIRTMEPARPVRYTGRRILASLSREKSTMMRNLMGQKPGILGLGLGVLLLFGGAGPARGDVKLPAIFGSHMVLQRGQNDRVWGWADAGEDITVRFNGQVKTTKAGADGKWTVSLDAMPAGGPFAMTVEGKNSLALDDVLVGEVWICSGQSNMQMAVSESNDGDLESRTAKYPEIRFISVPQVGTQEPQDDFKGRWDVCTPDTVKSFSAVGYFFGRQLYQTLGVPIGLIDDSWGGSACEAWIRRDLLASNEKYRPLMERWQKTEENFPQAKAAYEEKLSAWQAASEKARSEGEKPPLRPQDPEVQMRGNARPGNIYNGVLK